MNYQYWQHILEGKEIETRLEEGKMGDFLNFLLSQIRDNPQLEKEVEKIQNVDSTYLRDYFLNLGKKLNMTEKDFNALPDTIISEGILGDFFKDKWREFKESLKNVALWAARGKTPYILLIVLGHLMVTSSIILTTWFIPAKFLLIFLWHLFGFNLYSYSSFSIQDVIRDREEAMDAGIDNL